MDIEKHRELRKEWEQYNDYSCESTISDIHNTLFEEANGEEPSWAEWGYVIWLEKQVLKNRVK